MMRKIFHPFESRDEKRKELEEIKKFLYVHPRDSDEALLAGDVGAMPSTKSGVTLSLLVTEKVWSSTKISDLSSKISDAADKIIPREKEQSWKVSPGAEGKCASIARDKLLFVDSSGEKVIGMVVRHIHLSTQYYDIYCAHPIRPGQKASTKQKYQKKPFYHVGAVKRTEDEKGYEMQLYKGKGGYEDDAFTVEDYSTGAILGEDLVLVRRANKPAAVLYKGQFPEGVVTPAWECTVAPGIDPMIIACLVAIYDDQRL